MYILILMKNDVYSKITVTDEGNGIAKKRFKTYFLRNFIKSQIQILIVLE